MSAKWKWERQESHLKFECMPFETIYGESDLGEINAVWRKLPPQMQDELYAFMKQGLRFIDNQTGDTKV